jgi:hypothetical protein
MFEPYATSAAPPPPYASGSYGPPGQAGQQWPPYVPPSVPQQGQQAYPSHGQSQTNWFGDGDGTAETHARHLRGASPHGADGYQQPPHQPHQPQPQPQQPAMPLYEVTADIRVEVVSRLRRQSVRHSQFAWERRRTDPLSPNALAFFFAEPNRPSYEALRTATRVFLDDAEAADLPKLLFALARQAYDGFAQTPGFDPRTHMSNRCDPMSNEAVFIGVGVSTLNTPNGQWSEVQRRAGGLFDLPGRCYARLCDGTRLLIDRGALPQYEQFVVQSSTSDHNSAIGVGSMQWRWNPKLNEIDEADPEFQVWRWLGELGRILEAGTTAR